MLGPCGSSLPTAESSLFLLSIDPVCKDTVPDIISEYPFGRVNDMDLMYARHLMAGKNGMTSLDPSYWNVMPSVFACQQFTYFMSSHIHFALSHSFGSVLVLVGFSGVTRLNENENDSVADVSNANEFSASYVTIGVTDTDDDILSDNAETVSITIFGCPTLDNAGLNDIFLTPK